MGAGMTVREWIEGRRRPVPGPLRDHPAFQRCLAAGEDGVDVQALVRAAEAEIVRARTGSRRDHEAAFSLLAADAFITYACLWMAEQGDLDAEDLAGLVARVAGADWRS